jgi:hypothetical protein
MYINEHKINRIVEKNLHKLIKEDFHAGSNSNTNDDEFNQQYIDKNRKNRPDSWGTQTGKFLLKGGAIAAGAGILGSMTGLGGPVGVLAALGIGKLGLKLGKNLIALNRVKKLEFPRTAANAMEYAKFAAAERMEAQELCKKLQQSLQNAISAYNKAYSQDLDTQNTKFFGDMEAKFQDRGKEDSVLVDWDRDFSNVNAGQNESRVYENSAKDLNQSTQIVPATNFLAQFKGMGVSEAMTRVIFPLRKKYTEAYGLWMQWTRYINVLVHAYGQEGLTWDAVINSNNMSNTESMVKTFMRDKLGIKTGRDVNSYTGKNKASKLTVRVKSTSYMMGKVAYTLLKDDSSPKYYAIPQFTRIGSVILTKEMPLNLNIRPSMIKKEIPTQDGKTVYLLTQQAQGYVRPIMNGGKAQEF